MISNSQLFSCKGSREDISLLEKQQQQNNKQKRKWKRKEMLLKTSVPLKTDYYVAATVHHLSPTRKKNITGKTSSRAAITPHTYTGYRKQSNPLIPGKTKPRVSNQNGISQPYTIVKIYHSGQKPLLCTTLFLLLLLVRQMEIPVSPMKVAVHLRSLRLPYSLRATLFVYYR